VTRPLRLGVLDQSPIPEGSTAPQALQQTIALAQLADRLGYSRYWLAEHHNHPGLAGPAPEVTVAAVAAATERIRVGSGGVMLPHYSPLKVAEQFKVLEALHPGRIDLGLGRAPGSDPITALALNQHQNPDDFPNQVQDVIGWLEDRLDPRHPFARVKATPDPGGAPSVWLLGSSDYSAAVAAVLGTPFSFAHFINPRGGPAAAASYRENFRPDGDRRAAPQLNACVIVLCAETDDEVDELAKVAALWRLQLEHGRPGKVPSPERAKDHVFTDDQLARNQKMRKHHAIGTPDVVAGRLQEIAGLYGTDEILMLTITHDPAARRRSYELVAEACGLGTTVSA
jgi:luciferase family oxidoreductase group 1